MTRSPYDSDFFTANDSGSARTARAVVPMIFELIRPASVVDVGCGTGVWLSEFVKLGIVDVIGIDGDYVDRSALLIPPDRFRAQNLSDGSARIDRRFDLAMSLEVAEHLPTDQSDRHVELLTRAAPVVVFSAAIPYQEGTHHINCQWQSYWAERFEARGFVTIDALRSAMWDHPQVGAWYAQNMLVYADPTILPMQPGLGRAFQQTDRKRINVVHPQRYSNVANPRAISLRKIARALPHALRKSVSRRMG
jgi:SAM-dependent methyltransferase